MLVGYNRGLKYFVRRNAGNSSEVDEYGPAPSGVEMKVVNIDVMYV